MTPFDVIKQRMQLGYYTSMSHCIKTMIKQEGIRALYISFPMTIAMNIPYGSVMVPVNESMKKILNPSGKFNYQTSILAGAIAGAVAAAVTNPLDVIKTRLQTQNLQPAVSGSNAIDCQYYKPTVRVEKVGGLSGAVRRLMTAARPVEGVTVIVKRMIAEEGYRALLKGMVPRMLTQSPAVAISWTVYETIKDALATRTAGTA